MGLTNIEHRQAVNAMTELTQDLLKNPYYLFNDRKATIVDFFNLDVQKSTLDEAAMIPYSNLGKNSPLRFCVVYDMYVFGLERIMLNLENGDFGLESGEVTGDGFVLPNTIQPYAGSYFRIKYINKTYLFRINNVTMDTLQDGANLWKFEYKLDQLEDKSLLPLISEEYVFDVNNTGTKFNPIIKKSKYDIASKLDRLSIDLKKMYKSMYYNNKVQTFTALHLGIDPEGCLGRYPKYLYDPYMIEFMIRNNIMSADKSDYMYITHQTPKSSDFTINYTRSIWKILEDKDLDNFISCIKSTDVEYIDNPITIFQTRVEEYFQTLYRNADIHKIECCILNENITDHIMNGRLYTDNENKKYNILIKYFNDEILSVDDIIHFDSIIYSDSFKEEYYFLLPMTIYCIDYYIKNMIS